MSDLTEIKGLFSETQKTVEALRSDVEGLQGKAKDFVDTDRQEKMKADLAAKFEAEQKAMQHRVDALETATNRPGGAGNSADDAKSAKAFDAYLRKGVETDEFKAMSTSTQADGGFMVPDGMEDGIRKRQRRTSAIRSVANVVSFAGGTYDVMTERGDAGYEWAGEKSTRSETDTPTINRIKIDLHELSALPKVTQRILDNADFDVEGWLVGYVGERFSRAEESAFVAGDGIDKPKGFTTYSTATTDDASRAVETFQHRVSGANGDFASSNPADVLVKTFYDLQGAYQANATWLMKNTTAAEVSVLKDGDGAYLLRDMMNGSGVFTRIIQGRPMQVADDMPTYTGTGALGIAVGDFSAGYTIVDGKAVTVLRDPFSAKPHVLFYATKRVGGGATDFDAIKFIKFSS